MKLTENNSCCDINALMLDNVFISDSGEMIYPNFSNKSFINDIWNVAPVEQIVIKVAVILPLMIWGIFGNTCLFYIIVKNKHLQSPTNILIANTAFADFILLTVHPWFFLAQDLCQNYVFGVFGCHFEGGFECTILFASVMSLVAISYDRLNSIALPQENRLTIKNAKITIVLVWFIGLLFSTPLFIFRSYRERQWADFLEQYCTEESVITNIYWHIIIIIIVWIPLGTMLVCYITLFIKLRHYEKVVLRKMKTINVNYKKNVAKMMFIIVATFIICRVPLAAQIFYRNQLLKQDHIDQSQTVQNQADGAWYILWFTSRYMILLNAAINPVIYGLTSEKFRKAFQQTTVSKIMFAFDEEKPIQVKNKQKQNTSTSNNKNIFFIFKYNKKQKSNVPVTETVITNSDSRAPIINT